eukprot:scaffold53536_cov58-Phaeocystis_antarctica.AAC.3
MKTTAPSPCSAGRERSSALLTLGGAARSAADLARCCATRCPVSGSRPAAHATKGRCRPKDWAITPPSAGPMAKPISALCSRGAVVCARLRGVAMSDR